MLATKVFLVCCLACVLCSACAVRRDIVFRVKSEVLHEVDARLFGHFLERTSWDNEVGVEGALVPGTHCLRPDVLTLMKGMQIPVLRFPGGADVGHHDWRDLIDNASGRSGGRPRSPGHQGNEITNHFGYDEFLRTCETLGAAAILVVNFREALLEKRPLEEAAQRAASLVAYCNAPAGADLPQGMADWPAVRARNGRFLPYGVKIFQIGNETWLYLQELKKLLPGAWRDHYVDCLAAYIDAMRGVDPEIEIIVDGHDGDLSGIADCVRARLGSKISYMASHFYTPGPVEKATRDGREVPREEISDEEIWHAWVAVPDMDAGGRSVLDHGGILAARRHGHLVAATEWNWNGWWRRNPPRPMMDSWWARGVGAAGFLHALLRAGDVVCIGCQSLLVGSHWDITSIRVDPGGKTPAYLLPTGAITAFYAARHGGVLLRLDSENVPTFEQPYCFGGIGPRSRVAYVDALVTADETAVYFHAVNRHLHRPLKIVIDLRGLAGITGQAVHHLLQGSLENSPGSGMRIRQEALFFQGRRLEVVLPARSVSCIEFLRRAGAAGRRLPESATTGP